MPPTKSTFLSSSHQLPPLGISILNSQWSDISITPFKSNPFNQTLSIKPYQSNPFNQTLSLKLLNQNFRIKTFESYPVKCSISHSFFSQYFLIPSNFRASWVKEKKCCCRHIINLHHKNIYKIENITRIHYSHIPLLFSNKQVAKKCKFWTLGNLNLFGVKLDLNFFKKSRTDVPSCLFLTRESMHSIQTTVITVLMTTLFFMRIFSWDKRNTERCFPNFTTISASNFHY